MRPYESVQGVISDGRPYRDKCKADTERQVGFSSRISISKHLATRMDLFPTTPFRDRLHDF
jgi:hypothetical protein